MMKKCIVVSCGGLLIASITISADTLSLNEYVKLVLRNNPQPKIASSSVQASNAAYEMSRSQLLPHVTGNAAIARSESPDIRIGGIDNNSASMGIGGQLLLFDFGKTPYQYRASAQTLEAVKNDSQSTMASVILLA